MGQARPGIRKRLKGLGMNKPAALGHARALRGLRTTIAVALLVMLSIGLLLPVYGDEIGWRFQERAWIDFVDRAFSDLCGANTFARPPWFMMPIRWFSATANQAFADPLSVRLEGMICAFAEVGLLWALIARLEDDYTQRLRLQTLVCALLGLGMLPFLLVMSRPEQPLILTLTLMVLTALGRRGQGRALAWLKCTVILVLATIAASYHLKGVVFSPIALACLIVCARGPGSLAPRIIAGLALTAMMATAAAYWIGRFRCLGDPVLAHNLGTENFASALSSGASFRDIVWRLLGAANPLDYVRLAVPRNAPMARWVPNGLFPPALPDIFAIVMFLIWTAGMILALLGLLRFALREGWRGLANPNSFLALTILACVIVWSMSQANRNVYEAAIVLPLLVLLLILSSTLPNGSTEVSSTFRSKLVWAAGGATLLGQVIVLTCTLGFLVRAAGDPGYLPGQPYSVSIARYGEVRSDIAEAMRKAGMDPQARYRGLMVDEITYLALQRHLLPIHRLGVLELWNGRIDRPAQYLLSRRSDGAVTACRNLPAPMAAVAARSGEICAIPRPGLERLAHQGY
jgi:hypothetical protein